MKRIAKYEGVEHPHGLLFQTCQLNERFRKSSRSISNGHGSKVPLCNRNLGTRNARVLTRDQSMTQVERRRIDVEALCYFIRSTTSPTLATFTVSEASIIRSEIARTRTCQVSRCTSVDLWNSRREGWLFLFATEGESSRGKRISFCFKIRLERYSVSNMWRRLLGPTAKLQLFYLHQTTNEVSEKC